MTEYYLEMKMSNCSYTRHGETLKTILSEKDRTYMLGVSETVETMLL